MRTYKLILLFIISSFIVISCKTNNRIEIKPFPIKNIAKHSFNLNIDKLKDTICTLFNLDNQLNNKYLNNVFYYYPTTEDRKVQNKMYTYFEVETKKTALFSEFYFEKPNTINDIFIHDFGEYWESKLYYSKGKPLIYCSSFVIKMESINKETTNLSIEAIEPQVVNGISGYGPHGAIARVTKVESSSIEEYSILLYIANKLGDSTLQPLKIP